jgi:hypothetical protein
MPVGLIGRYSTLASSRNCHESEHNGEENGCVQQQSRRCGGTHGMCNHEKRAENGLRELVGFGVGHDEKRECRDERVLCLQCQAGHSNYGAYLIPLNSNLRTLSNESWTD